MTTQGTIRTALVLPVLTAMACLIGATGCGGTMGAWAYWFAPVPEQEVKAEYKLEKSRLLILVDGDKGWLPDPAIQSTLTNELIKEFEEHNVSHLTVPYEQIVQLRKKDPKFERRGAREVGKDLKADQVLHLNVHKFTLHDEVVAPAFKGKFVLSVKVLSTSAEKADDVRLWPSSSEGTSVEVTTDLHIGKGQTYNDELTRRLCTEMAEKVAKLFYDHKIPKPV